MTSAAIVLAAGASRRFGADKLGAVLDGEPLVAHAIRAARAAPVDRVILVARPGLEAGDWPGRPGVEIVELASGGLAESLEAGIRAAGAVSRLFVFLGDMPRVPHDLAGRLAEVIGNGFAALPEVGGRPGHPVLLSARALPALAALSGDEGAGRLLRGRADVVRLATGDPGAVADVDRPEDLASLPGRRR